MSIGWQCTSDSTRFTMASASWCCTLIISIEALQADTGSIIYHVFSSPVGMPTSLPQAQASTLLGLPGNLQVVKGEYKITTIQRTVESWLTCSRYYTPAAPATLLSENCSPVC